MKITATTTKIIVFADFLTALILTALVVYGTFRTTNDMTALTVLAGLWDGQLAVVIGFYLWKSKNENRSKHAMALVRELAEQYGADTAVRVAELVLKE